VFEFARIVALTLHGSSTGNFSDADG
jgi:hypothetical protein